MRKLLPFVAALAAISVSAAIVDRSRAGTAGRAAVLAVKIDISLADVYAGESATLRWNVEGATWCRASGSWSGDKPSTGEQQVGPLMRPGSFRLTCGNGGDEKTDSASFQLIDRPAPRGLGVFDIGCNYSHSLRDDPIVFPKQPGASHLHDFFGNRTTDAYSTPEKLRSAIEDDPGKTTCTEGIRRDGDPPASNGSGYWVPAMFVNGEKVNAHHIHVYYRNEANQPQRVFPPGFRMIAGDAKATAEEAKADRIIKWWCGALNNPAVDRLPSDCGGSQGIHAEIQFPVCWDGRADSPNHKDHLAYKDGTCPSTHRLHLPRILMHVIFNVDDQLGRPLRADDTITVASGGMWTMHADYMFAWDPFRLDFLVHTCLNSKENCKLDPPGGDDPPPDPDPDPKDKPTIVILGQSPASPRAGGPFSVEFAAEKDGKRLELMQPICNAVVAGKAAKVERREVKDRVGTCRWLLPDGPGGKLQAVVGGRADGAYPQKKIEKNVAGNGKDPDPKGKAKPKVAVLDQSPESPRAGQSFSVEFAVVKDGQRLELERVVCSAMVGERAAKVTRRQVSDRVGTCTWRLPAGAGGNLRAVVQGRVDGTYVKKLVEEKVAGDGKEDGGAGQRPKIELLKRSPEAHAGDTFTVEFAVLKGGKRVEPQRVVCNAMVGSKAAKLERKQTADRVVTCVWRLPSDATGTLRAVMMARVGGDYAQKMIQAKVS